MSSSASPTGAINPLPTQALGFYDDRGYDGVIEFATQPKMTVTIKSSEFPDGPLIFDVSAQGNSYSGSNTYGTLTMTVESDKECSGVITQSGSLTVHHFGAKLCDMPAAPLVLNDSNQQYVGTIRVQTAQVSITIGSTTTIYTADTCSVGEHIRLVGPDLSVTLTSATYGHVTVGGVTYSIVPGNMLPSPAGGRSAWNFYIGPKGGNVAKVGTLRSTDSASCG